MAERTGEEGESTTLINKVGVTIASYCNSNGTTNSKNEGEPSCQIPDTFVDPVCAAAEAL